MIVPSVIEGSHSKTTLPILILAGRDATCDYVGPASP